MVTTFFVGGILLAPKGASLVRRWNTAKQVAASLPPALSTDDIVWTYRIVKTFPHDRTASTQGLVFYKQVLLESTGGHSQSRLRAVEIDTGSSLLERTLAADLYGEGLAIIDDRAFQLTWEDKVCLIWNLKTMSIETQTAFPKIGWGATSHQGLLVTSDGSDVLVWRNPKNMSSIREVRVKSPDGVPVRGLNELEIMNSEILANVFMTNYIVRIEPSSGEVLGWIDCNGLLGPIEQARAGVLNGIAYDESTDRLFVTGKAWPKLFEIELQTRVSETHPSKKHFSIKEKESQP